MVRSTRDLWNTLAAIGAAKATFRSLHDTWSDTTHGLILTVLGGLADYAELNIMRSGGVRAQFLRAFCGRRTPHNRGHGDQASIRTLSLNVMVRFVPAEPSQNEKAPDLRVPAGNNVEISAAWKRLSKENTVYHSVKLDEPSFLAPIYANLVEVEGGHALVWSR
jgi:uncharacterized protein (DUF736 family)